MEPEFSSPLLQGPTSIPILRQINPVHASPIPLHEDPSQYYPPIDACFFQGVSFSQFPHQNAVCTPPLPTRATCPVNLIFLDLITRKMFGDQYRPLSSSLYTFPHSHLICSLLGLNILISTKFHQPSSYFHTAM